MADSSDWIWRRKLSVSLFLQHKWIEQVRRKGRERMTQPHNMHNASPVSFLQTMLSMMYGHLDTYVSKFEKMYHFALCMKRYYGRKHASYANAHQAYLLTLSEHISGTGVAIEAQQSAIESS